MPVVSTGSEAARSRQIKRLHVYTFRDLHSPALRLLQHDNTKLGIQSKRLKAGWDERSPQGDVRAAKDRSIKDRLQELEY